MNAPLNCRPLFDRGALRQTDHAGVPLTHLARVSAIPSATKEKGARAPVHRATRLTHPLSVERMAWTARCASPCFCPAVEAARH